MNDVPRRLTAEAIGTALLLFVIVGSGIAAADLGADAAIQLFAHAITVGLALGALIAMFAGVSGAHFNPAVTLALAAALIAAAVAVLLYPVEASSPSDSKGGRR